MISKSKLERILWSLDLSVFTGVFLLMNYNKFDLIFPKNNYLYLYFILIVFWSIFSSYYDKISSLIQKPLWLAIRIIFWSSLMSLLFVVITISFSELWSISRIFMVTFMAIMVFYELIVALTLKSFLKTSGIKVVNIEKTNDVFTQNKFFIKWIMPGILLLLLIYMAIVYLERGFFHYDILQEQNFLVIITAWGLSTLLTNRYKEPNSINHYYEIAPYIKASILTFLFLTFFYYSLRIDSESIQLIYKAGLLHSGLEIMAFFLYFFGQSKKNGHLKNKSKNQIKKINGQEPLSIDQTRFNKDGSYDRSELFKSLKTFRSGYENELTDFIWQTIKIEKISKDKVTILNTSLNINIELLFDNSRELLVNMHRLNDSRRINEYLLTAYSKLESGGLLVGNFIPLEKLKSHLRSQMPHFLYSIILPFYFIFHRVFPKLAITKQIYFIITRGRNRVLSKSEVLGRLAFCGYEIINEMNIEDRFYFVCKKKKTVSDEESPSYGPIVKLKRIGYKGEPLYIYKLRTMYPYSEFIQGDIYEKYHLDQSGKMKGDYRITSWGKIFRKYFIDEIPQFYNWLKGDLNLVGVRALSEHYFQLYPKDLQKKRINFKPGLIPPYYSDLPNSFDEIIESERSYLNKKENAPFLTDLTYFTRAISNILFSGARSK